MNINQETGEVVNSGRSPRFTLWVAFLVFATVTMGSAISVVSHLLCFPLVAFNLVELHLSSKIEGIA